MKTKGLLRLRLIMVAGFILGGLLFFKTVAGYRYVSGHLILDHLAGEAGSFVSELEQIVRAVDPADADGLDALLADFVSERTPQVAWVAIADRHGRIVASSADRPDGDLDPTVVARIYERQARGRSRLETRGGEEVLAAILPFRYRLRSDRLGTTVQSPGAGMPRFMLTEIALSTTGAASPYLPLRRNFVIGITASIALLVAMAMFWIRLQSYLRGRRLAEQVDLARTVQQGLLQSEFPANEHLDVAVEFRPMWDVAGDFYDVFEERESRIGIVLGDVSGKGLPASLLMATIHGSVRTAAPLYDGSNLPELVAAVNALLCQRSPSNRFATMAWGFLDLENHVLDYVNCGHLPPILLRRNEADQVEVQRLEPTGPVIGILEGAVFSHRTIQMQPGDILVLFSDGFTEVEDAEEEEFGEDRMVEAAREAADGSSAELLAHLLQVITTFAASGELADDCTALAIRCRRPPFLATPPIRD